jgi:hypothetical protein
MPANYAFDGGAFQYFAATMLMFYLVPGVWFLWSSYDWFKKASDPKNAKVSGSRSASGLEHQSNGWSTRTPLSRLDAVGGD